MKRAFIRLKVELHTLAFYIWLFPVAFFSLFALFIHPSIVTIACLLSGIICSLFYNNIIAGFDTLRRYRMIDTGYLDRFNECIYKPYRLEDYTTSKNIEEVNNLSPSGFANRANIPLLSGVFDESLHIYAVKKSKSAVCPKQLVSYMIPFDASYIFVRDEPENIRSVGRYFIYHEIGHTLFTAARHQVRILYGNRTMLLLAVWLLVISPWSLTTGVIEVTIAFVCIYLSIQYNQRSEESRFEDEIWADNFAVSSLSVGDKQKLLDFFGKYPFPKDPDLSDEQNVKRAEYLLKNLKFSIENIGLDENNNLPEIFRYDNASQAYTPLSVYLAAALVFLSSLVIVEPTGGSLLRSSVFVTVPIVIFLVVLSVRCSLAKMRIESGLLSRQK